MVVYRTGLLGNRYRINLVEFYPDRINLAESYPLAMRQLYSNAGGVDVTFASAFDMALMAVFAAGCLFFLMGGAVIVDVVVQHLGGKLHLPSWFVAVLVFVAVMLSLACAIALAMLYLNLAVEHWGANVTLLGRC
jgi:hypothetical protein